MKKNTILLIDDEASQRQSMRTILRSAGYKVLEGADYSEALAVHHQNRGKIDLLLTDVSLPGRNGCELSQVLEGIDAHIKVILMSGPVGAEICRFYGLTTSDPRFLQKPFSPEELLQRVRDILGPAEFCCGAAV